MNPYAGLITYLLNTTSSSPPTVEVVRSHVNAVRLSKAPATGSLSLVWPALSHVLSLSSVPALVIDALVNDVIESIITSRTTSWKEISDCIGSQALIATANADTANKIRQAAVDLLSLYDLGDENEVIVKEVVALITLPNVDEGLIARVENAVFRYVQVSDWARGVVIKELSKIVSSADGASAVTISRAQAIVRIVLERYGFAGLQDPLLLVFPLSSDDVLASITTMEFYETLNTLNLPPSFYSIVQPVYESMVKVFQSSGAMSLERTAAARTIASLSKLSNDLFQNLDVKYSLVKNLTVRDDADQVLLSRISSSYLVTQVPELIRNFPVGQASLMTVLANLCQSDDAIDLLRLDSARLLRLPVPDLLSVALILAGSRHGTEVLASLPGVMESVLQRTGRKGYEVTRLRGDVVDKLTEWDTAVLGAWADKVRDEHRLGVWAREGAGEAHADVQDQAM
ncbi:hypothetical protein V1514DRAFT_330643 [Lipomyces japonicus]|uniref:uncharacterized protein n=1 Tax=Lipomyces japonicus TaxID=56871 RepID=UPI0034CE1B2B